MNKSKEIAEIQWLEKISVLLDSKFSLPGTKFKFGLDPIIGLIPVVGDLSTLVVSGILLKTIAKHGGSRKMIILMTINILLDALIGSIPILGSLFDFGFKSNLRNIKLLKEYYSEGKHTGSGNGIILLIVFCFLLLVSLFIFGIYKLIIFISSLF